MIENLEYYQSRGYNAVLVTFTTGEPLYRLADTIDYLKSCGLTVIIAYAGRENLNESLFRDPAGRVCTCFSQIDLGQIF